jgi:hypothetical protein
LSFQLWLSSWLVSRLFWWCEMPIVNSAPVMNRAKNVSSTATAKPSKASTLTKDRAEALTSLGQFAQVPLIATKQFADAGAVSLYWPGVATELANLAESQPAIAKLIDPLMQVGPYSALIMAVLPFVLQIGVNHRMVSPGAMGTVPATSLSSQVEASLAKQELEALTIQRDAEKEAAEMRAEIAASRKALAELNSESA